MMHEAPSKVIRGRQRLESVQMWVCWATVTSSFKASGRRLTKDANWNRHAGQSQWTHSALWLWSVATVGGGMTLAPVRPQEAGTSEEVRVSRCSA